MKIYGKEVDTGKVVECLDKVIAEVRDARYHAEATGRNHRTPEVSPGTVSDMPTTVPVGELREARSRVC